MRNLTRSLRDLNRSIQKNTLALFYVASGWAVGALTNKYTDYAAFVFCAIALVLLVSFVRDYLRSHAIQGPTNWELTLRDPTEDALRACERANEHYLVMGDAVELIAHPQLNSRSTLTDLGWPPQAVAIRDRQAPFDASSALRAAGGLKAFDPPNGEKYSLVSSSLTLTDRPTLSLSVAGTDYFTIRTVLEAVRKGSVDRAQLGSLESGSNHIPHSLCLHFVVRFASGEILFMKRDKAAAYHAQRWSCSGEEQVAAEDFTHPNPCLALFQRTVCEEVLPLREKAPLETRWSIAQPLVESMALWSVFLEAGIHNFSLLGFIQLACEPEDFVETHRRLVADGTGSRDKEGRYFTAQPEQMKRLLIAGDCTVQPLFGAKVAARISAQDLHPTSRYRIYRLLRGLDRGPLRDDGSIPS